MDVSMDSYFNSFSLRTKVQGSSREERFNNALSRWRKTTEDSKLRLEREGGEYTAAFYESHRIFLEGLDKHDSIIEKFAYLNEAKYNMSSVRSELFKDLLPSSQAKVDAFCFLIEEINEIFKD